MVKYFLMGLMATTVFTSNLVGQNEPTSKYIDWNTLADVKFKEKYHEKTKEWYLYPTFGAIVTALNAKPVRIKGYVIPLDVDNGVYALSAYPFAACFFCGGAGPESVVSLKFKGKHKNYKTDQVVTFAGTLKLNSADVNEFNYILENAVEWK